MSKRVLLIAFHFPPIKVSSGLERTLALTRHLPTYGWQPAVLSASPRAYPATSDERMDQIPAGTPVRRSFARDANQALSIAGRYPDWVTLPDRWASWVLSGIPAGMSLIREFRPDLIWSTYPIASAHLIGCALHRLSGIPWVADFRDPMVEFNERQQAWSPSWPALRRWRLWTEKLVARHASAVTTCTDGSRAILMQRYPQADHQRWHVVSNGYDETAFEAAQGHPAPQTRRGDELLLLHSGTIYPTADRDPSHFLRALRQVLDRRPAGSRPIRVILRASQIESLYMPLIQELQLAAHVSFAPSVPYQAALFEMCQVDGLLIFQGYTSNPAIPAKLYEYLRAQRPILALADAEGDTAKLVRQLQAGMVSPLDDVPRIVEALETYLQAIESGQWQPLPQERFTRFERAETVRQFATVFDGVGGRR